MENILTRKNLIILLAVILVIIAGVFFFGQKGGAPSGGGIFGGIFPKIPGGGTEQPPPAGGPQYLATAPISELGELQNSAELKQWALIALGNDPITSLVAFGTTTRYHKNTPQNLGHLFERTKWSLGKETKISNLLLQQIVKIIWAPTGKRAVAEYLDDRGNVRKFLIEYRGTTSPRTRFLDNSIGEIVFSSSGDSVVYIQNAGESHNIFTASTDFKNPKKVLDNNIPLFELSWPSANTLALKTKSSYAGKGFLYTVNAQGGLLNKVIEGFGLDAIWNGDGSLVAYSSVDSSGSMELLRLVKVAKKEVITLPMATIAEKCVFGKKEKTLLICGVPKTIPPGRYPDEWWQGKVSFQEAIVVIDTVTQKQIVAVSTASDIINPVIFGDDSYLFFRDKLTDKLWALKLVDDSQGAIPAGNQ